MKSFFNRVLSYALAHKIIASFIILVVIIEGVAIARGAGTLSFPTYTLMPVRIGTVSETVTGTGQVEGADQVDITPKGSGQVTSIEVKPGDMVTTGQVLVTLDETSALLALTQAKANLESAEASYEKLVDGLTPQQQALDESAVTNAEQSLTTQLISAYTSTDNTIRTNIDDMFTDAQNDPAFTITFLDSSGNLVTFTTPNGTLAAQIDGERSQLNSILPAWGTDVGSLNIESTSTDITPHVTLALQNLQYVENFLNNLSGAVYGISAQDTKYQSNLDSYKSAIASALSSVNSNLSSLTNANQSLVTANAQYAEDTAPPVSEDVSSSQASVDQAQASLQSAQDTYNDNIVTAPFSGEIAAVDVEPGDIAGGSTVVATLTTTDKIADISLNEVDAALVNVGDPAILTFDALPNVNVPAHVAEMALVGTVSSGVVDYDVKLSIDPVATSTATTTGGYAAYAAARLAGGFASSTNATSTTFGSSTRRFSGGGAGGFSGGAGSGVSVTPSIPFTAAIYNEIKPGMSVTAAITTASHSGVLVIPSAAIKTSSNGVVSYVQTLPGVTTAGTVTTATVPQNIQVMTGLTNGTQTEITSGLSQGQMVITRTTSGSSAVPSAAAAATTRTAGGFGGGGAFGAGAAGGAAAIRAL